MTFQTRPTLTLLGLTLALGTLPACLEGPGSASGGHDRQDKLGIICEAKLKLTGNISATQPQPADVYGCWPVGTWTMSASVEDTDCATAPTIDPSYTFQVARDPAETEDVAYTYALVGGSGYQFNDAKVTSGGGGLCEGGIKMFSADGKTLYNFTASLNADGTITGFGEVEVYGTAQF